jgi:hypothetical protein
MTESVNVSVFWVTVSKCLVDFYDVEPEKASGMVEAARARLVKLGSYEGDADLIYHAEPIDIAGDMMRRTMPVRKLIPVP